MSPRPGPRRAFYGIKLTDEEARPVAEFAEELAKAGRYQPPNFSVALRRIIAEWVAARQAGGLVPGASADSMPGTGQHEQNRADDGEDQPDQLEDADAERETDDQQDQTEDEHGGLLNPRTSSPDVS